MGYTALYRKFRPQTFDEIVGQEHITKTLKNQLKANRVGHAYLFSGSRGTGKTSAAKILARAVNCLNPKDGEPCNECEMCKGALSNAITDIVEMDAASNNGVDNIRLIREEVNFLPTKAKYRVYIIDEVHMLSIGAFNALLKTLEEPPEHVKFILATTEPQKIPATILSRCQRFDFKRIQEKYMIERLKYVCDESKVDYTEEALKLIATLSEGAMRDALSILERCVQDGLNQIDIDKIKELVGIPQITNIHLIISAIINYNITQAMEVTNAVLEEGKDLNNFIWEIIKYIKDILIYKISEKIDLYNKEEIERIKEIANTTSKERLSKLIFQLSKLEARIKATTQKTIVFEAGIIELCIEGCEEEYKPKTQIPTINKSEKKLEVKKEEKENKIDIYNAINTKELQKEENPETKKDKVQVETNKKSNINFLPKVINNLKSNGKMMLGATLKDAKAQEVNDMTVEIRFSKPLNPFEKTTLNADENKNEIAKLISMELGKDMHIKYVENQSNNCIEKKDDIKKLAFDNDIPFFET